MFKKFLSLLLAVMMVVSVMAVGVVSSTAAPFGGFSPTEAPWYPTEEPIPTEPDLPHDPSNYIFLNVDGALYEVEAGSNHTYAYYLNVYNCICGVDAKTTWDAPCIEIVSDPTFPVFGNKRGDIDDEDSAGDVVYQYLSDTDGNIDEIRFNWTQAEGVTFDSSDSMLITFKIHIAEDAPAGIYNIHTDIEVLEGEHEEKLIFEGVDCNSGLIYEREGMLDGAPGALESTNYTVDEQTFTTYSYEDKTFTVRADHNDALTYSKFRALYIDGMPVSYGDFTKESGSLILTLKADYMQRMECGDHDVLFVFSDGEANSILHILQGSPATPDEPDDIPSVSGKTINFNLYSTGWSSNSEVLFYVYEVSTGTELIPWGSKKLIGTNRGDGICSYDPSLMNLVPGIQYAIIFSDRNTGAQTYDLLFDTSCLGDTAYCTGNMVENPVDANKASLEAKWKNHPNLGPRLQISSIGNVVGETCPSNTTPYKMLVDFLKNTLSNARDYSGKTDQQLLDHIASQLDLSNDDVSKAIAEAGVWVNWTPPYVPPTEPPIDSYGYIPGEYYLTGSINGDNSGTTNVHKGLRFTDYSADSMILESVRLTQGDVVRVARYNGNNTFTVYPDGIGREVAITQSGRYDFYFKPYELGNGNYWYITPSYRGEVEAYLLGDADGNGKVDAADVTHILRYLTQTDTPYTKSELMRGDVDGSGDLEVTDVTAIQYYLARINTPYPIGLKTD